MPKEHYKGHTRMSANMCCSVFRVVPGFISHMCRKNVQFLMFCESTKGVMLIWKKCCVSLWLLQKAEEELYSSSSQLRKRQEELSKELLLYDTHSNLQRSGPQRRDDLMREFSTNERQLMKIQDTCKQKWVGPPHVPHRGWTARAQPQLVKHQFG